MIANQMPLSAQLMLENNITSQTTAEQPAVEKQQKKIRDFDEMMDAFGCCGFTAKKYGMTFEDIYPLIIFLLYKSCKRGEYVGAIIHTMITSMYDEETLFYLGNVIGVRSYIDKGTPKKVMFLFEECAKFLVKASHADIEDFYGSMYPNFRDRAELFFNYFISHNNSVPKNIKDNYISEL